MSTGTRRPARRAVVRGWRVARFAGYFASAFIRSNLEVFWEIVRPRRQAAPAIVALPMPGRSHRELVSLANLITLTPGTLTLDVVADPPTLYVHGMFARDPEAMLRQLRRLEARMLAAVRPVGAVDTERLDTGGATDESV